MPGCRGRGVTEPLLWNATSPAAPVSAGSARTPCSSTRGAAASSSSARCLPTSTSPGRAVPGSHCGTCTACLEACPTQAFPEPFVLDATQCISYLTIELARRFRSNSGSGRELAVRLRRVPGRVPVEPQGPPARPRFPHDPELAWLDPVELLGLDEAAFRRRFKRTSLWRNRRPGLLRNAAIVLGNTGDERALPVLESARTERTTRSAKRRRGRSSGFEPNATCWRRCRRSSSTARTSCRSRGTTARSSSPPATRSTPTPSTNSRRSPACTCMPVLAPPARDHPAHQDALRRRRRHRRGPGAGEAEKATTSSCSRTSRPTTARWRRRPRRRRSSGW